MTPPIAPDQALPQGNQQVQQARSPLHGVTLEMMVTVLADRCGWADLGEHLPLRCFTSDLSVTPSLKMLRRTPWARQKVDSLYLFMLREQRREGRR